MLRKTPGSSSAKTPSLASARRRRCSVSGSAPASRGELGDRARARRRAPRRTPSSATIASARVPSAPRSRSQSGVLRARRSLCAAGEDAAATSSTSASVSVRQSSSRRPSRTTPTTGGSPAAAAPRASSSTAQAKLGSSASGSAPPPTRATVSSTSPPTAAREPLGAGADGLGRLVQHPQHRNLARGALRVEVERERALERGERELVRAQRALERVAAQPLDELGAADDDPGLRAAEQLVAGEADEVGAGGEALAGRSARRRACDERAGAEVVDEREAVPAAPPRPARPRDGCSVKPTTRKFDWCTRSRTAVSGPIAALVVGGARAVRRPDLDEPRARAREHVRDAEAVADLDQLAARDEHLAALRERGEREQDRGGVVVDDERRLGAGQPPQDRGDVVLARAARARRRGRTRGSSSRGRPRARARARPPASGARPRFVCTITPVAFSARRRLGARAAASSRSARSPRSPGSWPARISSRARSRAVRAASTASAGGSPASRSSRASSSTEGRSRSSISSSVGRQYTRSRARDPGQPRCTCRARLAPSRRPRRAPPAREGSAGWASRRTSSTRGRPATS